MPNTSEAPADDSNSSGPRHHQAHQPYRVPLRDSQESPVLKARTGSLSPSHFRTPSNSRDNKWNKLEAQKTPTPLPQNGTDSEKSGAILGCLFLGMVVAGSFNRIFSKLECYPMHNYPIFLSMVGTFAYVPLCFAYILPVEHFYPGIITAEQKAIPRYKFAIMGMMDSLAVTSSTFAVNYITNASLIILLQQAAIPISMVISAIFLQARYTTYQYWGATIVMCGIAICVFPSLGSGDAGGLVEAMWMGVLVVSCIPMCFSSVYKEKALGEVDMDVIYLNGWVNLYTSLFTIFLAIPSAYSMGIPTSHILPNMYDGWQCYLGIDPINQVNGLNSSPTSDCSSAFLLVNTYIFFNVIYNVLLILILKYGSANILWLASTVMVPFGNIVFSLPFVPGSQPLTTPTIWSLFLMMLGLILYRFYGSFIAWIESRKAELSPELQETFRQQKFVEILAVYRMRNYVGINQAEWLEPLVDAHIFKEQKQVLYRSSLQIRRSFLARLGLPPSPGLTSTPKTRRNLLNRKGQDRAPLLR